MSRRPRRTLAATLALAAVTALAACQDQEILAPADPIEEEPGPVAPRMASTAFAVEGYPTAGELREGYIWGRDGRPMPITYEVHDGLAIWQGDIVLGPEGRVARTPGELASSAAGPFRGVVIDGAGFRWPGGVIPYTITDATVSIVNAAIDLIEDQTPGVTLIPRTSESDYVTFQDASGCSSAIGRQGGQQFINLKVDDGDTFCSTGNAAHEILHALGMYHEHTRCDRDAFVTINYANIEGGKEGNFFKAGSDDQADDCGDDQAVFDIGAYDYGSMMHYGPFAFAVDETIQTITSGSATNDALMGQRSAVGPTDQETIDQLYGANNAAPTVVVAPLAASYPEGTPVPFDASGSTDADDDDDLLTFAWTFGDGTCPGPAACTDDSPAHPYADDGSYGWSVDVSDGFDAGNAAGNVLVTNVAPTVAAGPDATIDEGDLFSRGGTFADPGADSWSATVDYDEGAGPEALALAGKTFQLSNTYVDNNPGDAPYTVTVTVTDDDGGEGSDQVDVTVLNVAPTVDAGPDAEVVSGETYDFSGSFSDPGLEDDPWTWVIDWGFGPNTMGSTDDQAAPIEVSRQVCVAGTYTVDLTVTDKDGAAGSDDLTLTVPYFEVAIDVMPGTDNNPLSLSQSGSLSVAILSAPDFDALAVDLGTLTLGDEVGSDTPIHVKNNGSFQTHTRDVDGDGLLDVVVTFPAGDLVDNGDLTELSTELVLIGFRDDGCTHIRGTDAVTVLGT